MATTPGINKRDLVITIDGVDVSAEAYDVQIVSGDASANSVTFAQARAGGNRKYTFKATVVMLGAVWAQVWGHAGESKPIVIKPNGGTVASTGTPFFTANATITEPNGTLLGGAADADPDARWTIEVEWQLDGKPTRVVS